MTSLWYKSVIGSLLLGLFGAGAVFAQSPARVRISLADAVTQAQGNTPSLEIAGLQVQEANARVREARAALLPSATASAGWLNQSLNKHAFCIDFPTIPGQPGIPDLIGPFSVYDTRFQVRQPLLDLSSLTRVQATRSVATSAEAQRSVTSEQAAQRAALAYLQGVRAAATLSARQADAGLADELLSLAQTELQAGVGEGIDVTRAEAAKAP